ncbi:hypothetical protein [Streptomyces sp. NPDC026589]|uniref:hypothetical protein n=1 Tax=Streptomyces sp. NPDC026589 TaxID=3155609 RepID=UPI0033CD5789
MRIRYVQEYPARRHDVRGSGGGEQELGRNAARARVPTPARVLARAGGRAGGRGDVRARPPRRCEGRRLPTPLPVRA